MAPNPVMEKHTKHIDIQYHFVCDAVLDNKVQLYYIEGSENPADMFTKNLGHITNSKQNSDSISTKQLYVLSTTCMPYQVLSKEEC